MARTVNDEKFGSPSARSNLSPSGKPYYRALHEGLHIGYRKGKNAGKWVARWYVGRGSYHVETIAQADDQNDANGLDILTFRQAQEAARKLYNQRAAVPRGEQGQPYTVKDAIEAYLEFLEKKPRGSARDARWRAKP